MKYSCGCCACLAGAGGHQAIFNRPGLSALHYRVGTHQTFFDAMIRRLTIPASGDVAGYSLHALTTREADDPAIAFLDAWATVGDVLTFYQERIANEGFLRTARERRSVLELGRLVGYKLKPGVSASVYLAYTVDETTRTIIPAGSKSQSIPGADEKPQMFETSFDLEARGQWNALKPRLSKAQVITIKNVLNIEAVWTKGTSVRINRGDSLLFVFESEKRTIYAIRRALKVTTDSDNDRTEIALQPVRAYYTNLLSVVHRALVAEGGIDAMTPATPARRRRGARAAGATTEEPRLLQLFRQILLGTPREDLQPFGPALDEMPDVFNAIAALDVDDPQKLDPVHANVNTIVKRLAAPMALAPANEWAFPRSLETSLKRSSDYLPRLITNFLPQLSYTLYGGLAAVMTQKRDPVPDDMYLASLHVLHRSASVFGYNAPSILFEDPPTGGRVPALPHPDVAESATDLFLDTQLESLTSGTYVAVTRRDDPGVPPRSTVVLSAREVENLPRTAYGVSGKTTLMTLDAAWASLTTGNSETATKDNLAIIRTASVLTESEELKLAQVPITRIVGKVEQFSTMDKETEDDESEIKIELDSVVEGLQPGRWVIISGERSDTGATSGVIASELAMIVNLELKPAVAGARPYSVLHLAPEGIHFHYKRATVTIYGNVVKATHGDTFNEILGSGDAAKSLQTFALHQKPLTFVSAPTIDGVASTLAIRVNDVLWHEVDSFYGADPADRLFVTKIANDGTVSVTFGNGREGSRVPTAPDNVRAVYRAGIGKPGNVHPRQIATMISHPLGAKNVVNPLPASGGADPESRDDARRNIPVSLQAMGRVVSVQDFADFARTFAGINKATAVAISDGRRNIVHLTVGGAGDIEIDIHSDLYRNLVEALGKYGDPYQPFVVAPREKVVLAGSANVRVHPDYLWENVAPKIRKQLLDVFSYDRRDFSQVAFPAEVVAAIQSVKGVVYVDLDTFGGIAQEQIIDLTEESSDFGTPRVSGVQPVVPQFARLSNDGKTLLPAQIAYLPPQLADLFILTEIKPDEQ